MDELFAFQKVAVVLLFSGAANDSDAVSSELEIAFNRSVPITSLLALAAGKRAAGFPRQRCLSLPGIQRERAIPCPAEHDNASSDAKILRV